MTYPIRPSRAMTTLATCPQTFESRPRLMRQSVVPNRRSQGIGTDLIAAARSVLRQRACPEIHVNVDEVDGDTRRFYKRQGFVNVEPGSLRPARRPN